MPYLDRAKAKQLGYTDDEINKYLAENQQYGLQEAPATATSATTSTAGMTATTATPAVPTTTAAPTDSPLAALLKGAGVGASNINLNPTVDPALTGDSLAVKLLKSKALPTVGSILGGIAGATGGSLPGEVAGSAAGGAGGEALRRGLLRMMGENPDKENTGILDDVKATAEEGILSGLFAGVGGVAGKALSKAGGATAKVMNLQPENFVRRSINTTGAKTAEMNLKLGIKESADNTLSNLLLKDVSKDGRNILSDIPVPERLAFADERIAELAADRAQIYATSDKVFDLGDVKSKVLAELKDDLFFKGTDKMKSTGEPVLKEVDRIFGEAEEAYGSTLKPQNLEDLENSLGKGLSNFKEGELDVKEVEKRIKNGISGITNDIPGVKDLNRKMSAYYDVQDTLGKAMNPQLSMGNTFGSAIQAAPLLAGAATLGGTGDPKAGGAVTGIAYLGAFMTSLALKDPQIAGRIARTLFKINSAAAEGELAPFLKTFYTATRPVLSQSAKGLVDGAGGKDGESAKGSLLLDKTLPQPDQNGMTDLPAGEFISKDAINSKTGELHPQKVGLTKQDAAIAMLLYPKQASLIKSVYDMLGTEQDDKLNAAQKTQLTKVNSLYSILNMSKHYMAKIGAQGQYAGNASVLANKIFQNNPDLAAYEELRNSALPVIARVIGGDVGNLNEQEQKRVENMLPRVTDTPAIAAQKFAVLESLLDDKLQAVKTGTFDDGTTDANGDGIPDSQQSNTNVKINVPSYAN